MKSRKGVAAGSALIALLALTAGVVYYVQFSFTQFFQTPEASLENFETCSGIIDAFNRSQSWGYPLMARDTMMNDGAMAPTAAESKESGSGEQAADYSTTNVQVEGVDEADIVKTDGEYIYIISGDMLVVTRAYPADDAEVLSETGLGNFTPSEMFIDGDSIMLFGYSTEVTEEPYPYPVDYPEAEVVTKSVDGAVEETATDSDTVDDLEPGVSADTDTVIPRYYPRYVSYATVQLWDVSDREDPEKLRQVDFDGSYLTARKIGDRAYFVINSYPQVYPLLRTDIDESERPDPETILPTYRDSEGSGDFEPSCGCSDVGMLVPSTPQSFVTIASMSMTDPEADIEKEVVVGSGQTVYASQDNLYIAEYVYSWGPVPFLYADGMKSASIDEPTEITAIYKFSLDDGYIEYAGSAEVPGHLLNQFSMDEYDGYFRIAMTEGRTTRDGSSVTTNNVYVYDDGMDLVGSLEDLAPGESIYSARFMGDRAYLVTFRKIDPLFVIDLSDPRHPELLGKLKIPGYSDYLHPYDENHIIGIGKDTVPADEDWGDFVWYQGVKIALFDVSDVEHPVEMYSEVIGDRGTDSEALYDHKSFLFDREKELLVIPVLLAEFSEDPGKLPDWSYGDYVFQGAYVYSLDLDNGFDLRGRITHFDSSEAFDKSGYYFYDDTYTIRRSLYIEDVLYTVSRNRMKLNDLSGLDEIATLDFGDPREYPKYWIMEDVGVPETASASSASAGISG